MRTRLSQRAKPAISYVMEISGMRRIGFIGLGNMGAGMCLNLIKAGHCVRAYDIDANAVQSVVAAGASAAGSIAEVVEEADVIISMLPSGEHVLEVYFGIGGASETAKPGAVFIDCSTISVGEAREAAMRAGLLGYEMLDAPVSGGAAAANAGTLTFMVGGPASTYSAIRPLLADMGVNFFHAGGAGNGQAAKIANNMLLGISMIGTCEAFALAEKLGLDSETFFRISSVSSGQCWSMTSYCPVPGPVPASPANYDYKAGFAVAMMLKDLRLAADAARSSGVAVPLGEIAKGIYEDLSERGFGGLDFSGVIKDLKGTL